MRVMSAPRPENLPIDILPLIFEHIDDRRDLHTCALLSRAFNDAATPILYRSIESRTIKTGRDQYVVIHPSTTLLARPDYAKYVRHISATSSIGYNAPGLLKVCTDALRLCINLESCDWSDDTADGSKNNQTLLAYIDILKDFPLKEFTVRTYLGMSEELWSKLKELRGLRRIALWCMEGQPRILQGWSERLGDTLTHLVLGRCAGVPATILVSVLSHVPLLRVLRLKGASSSAILELLTLLPHLVTLDTEYLGSGIVRYRGVPVASLRELTVRTSSVDMQGPQQLWTWIQMLLPRQSLEAFTLNAFSTQGDATIPRRFLLDLAVAQAPTLRRFNVESAQLTLDDIQCLCSMFPALEALSCATFCQHPHEVESAIANAHNLRELRTHMSWVPSRHVYGAPQMERIVPFEIEHAHEMMLRKGSHLRVIGIGRVLYTGRWVLTKAADGSTGMELDVVRDVVHDSWM